LTGGEGVADPEHVFGSIQNLPAAFCGMFHQRGYTIFSDISR
jgi:hypothetical protein